MIITGTGGTDFYPSSESSTETLVVTILVLLGAFTWTYVLALFCDMATNANPALTDFRQRLDGLNQFISINSLPGPTAMRIRAYLHQQKSVALQAECSRSLPMLSMPLQVEIVMHVNRYWLNSIWFIKGLEAPVKVLIAREMKLRVLAPGESAATRRLYVIQRGTIVFGARLLTRQMSFGDDVILSDPRYFLQFAARAITFADVLNISRDALYQILENYPHSAKKLRRSTIHLALRRSVVNLSRSRGGGVFSLAVPDAYRRDASIEDNAASRPSHSASTSPVPGRSGSPPSLNRLGMRSRIFEGINQALVNQLEAPQRQSMEVAHVIDKFEADHSMLQRISASQSTASSSADPVSGSAIPAELAAQILATLGELKDSVSTLQQGQDKAKRALHDAQTESAARASEMDERLRQIEMCLVRAPMNGTPAEPHYLPPHTSPMSRVNSDVDAAMPPEPLSPPPPSWPDMANRMFNRM